MHSTSFYIEHLKISNFLSFFGVQEVRLERFRAITCNYSEGKRDLLRALEFVLGANLKQLHVDSAKYLLHRVFWKDDEKKKEVTCFVEFSLNLKSEKSMKFYRGVKNSGIEHRIDDKLVSNLYYEELLNNFNISVNRKNMIFRTDLFYGVIWGNPEDLEKTIAEILRTNSNLEEWTRAKEKMKYLQENKKILLNNNLKNMKKSHETIEKFVESLNGFVRKRDRFHELLNLEYILEDDTSPSASSASKSEIVDETNYKSPKHDIASLEKEEELLLIRCRNLEREEIILFCQLFVNEVRISSKPAKEKILLERIIKLKAKLREHENCLPLLWSKMEEMHKGLKELERNISNDLGNLWELQQSIYLTNRFTKYGRFIDYLHQNKYVDELKKILGEEIVYGNLCDDMETAVFSLNTVKGMKHRKRETFIIFKNYSAKLKDFLLGSGEAGIRINNIQELQIFLCHIKQYGLISEVPILISRRFNFKLEEGKNYNDDIMYTRDGVFLKSDGLIIYTSADDEASSVPGESLLERLNSLLIRQDVMYEECRDLIFDRFQTLRNIADLEDDIHVLKFALRRSTPSRFVELEKRHVSSVYDQYITLFKEYDRQADDLQRELEESEEYLRVREKSLTFSEDRENSQLESFLASASAALEDTENEKIKTRKELLDVQKKLRHFYVNFAIPAQSISRHPVFKQPKMKTIFYYEKELENLKLLMSKNEVEEFEGWKDWRKEVIRTFIPDMCVPDNSFKALKATLQTLTTSRKKLLSPILEHCSQHLSSVLNFMMDVSLPFLDLTMSHSEDGLRLITSFQESFVNITEIANLNTFLKLTAALSLFLEIAVYDKIPILFLDDIEEFLPRHNDNFDSILNENALKRVLISQGNTRFQVLMRMAQFFEYFIKKNNRRNGIRRNGNKSDISGPGQFIYFTSGDLVHFSEHQLQIRSKILPDEFVTEDCDSYSCLEEIHFE